MLPGLILAVSSCFCKKIRLLLNRRRRLEKRIYIPLPVNEERLELLRLNLKVATAPLPFISYACLCLP